MKKKQGNGVSVGNVSGNIAIGDNNQQTNVVMPDAASTRPAKHRIKVLFLAANPVGTTQLKLDEEARNIKTKIRSADHRDSIELVTRWATRPDDLQQELLEQRPQIVHFSGHGSSKEGIVLVDDQGRPKSVSSAALCHLLAILKDDIRLVVLNACHSQEHAEVITREIDFAIGMETSIGDDAAIAFAGSFYRALGFGRSVSESFQLGVNSLMLEGIPEEQTPALCSRDGVDPTTVAFLGAS